MNQGAFRPTRKLLDLLLPVLQLLKPTNSYPRKTANQFIDRNWRDPNKTNIIEGDDMLWLHRNRVHDQSS